MAEMRVSRALAAAMRSMPAEAITGVIDALLEASQPRISTVFHQLLSMFSEECQEMSSNHQLFMTFKSAMLHLLRASDSTEEELDSLVQMICVPLMLTNSAKASKLFAEAVAVKSSWDYALSSIIPSCSAALHENSQAPEKKTLNGFIEVNRAAACQIVTDLLTVAVQNSSESFCGTLVEFSWSPCLRLLSGSLDDTMRNVVMQTLLPSLLKAIKALSWKNARYFSDLHDLWICCKALLSREGSQRCDAFNILTMLVDDMEKVEPDIRELRFWEEIQAGLVDEDTLTRKRALFVLKHALKFTEETRAVSTRVEGSKRERWAQQEAASLGVKSFNAEAVVLTSSQQWDSFFLLYDTLDEYGIHLVEAAWENQMSALANCRFAKETADCLNFSWISLLFERGFKHGNPQVRRHIVQSFFATKWSCVLHREFVLGPLVQALNDPVHHKDFGVNGAYTSEVGARAAKFFEEFSGTLDVHAGLHFITTLSDALREQLCSRAGLMTIASCMEAVAVGCPKKEFINSSETEALLESSRNVVEQSRTHFNPCYRAKICDHVLKVVSSFVKLPEVNSGKLSYFLAAFPRECFSPHGSLRDGFESWLNAFPEQTQETLHDGLKAELLLYLKPPGCKTSVYVFEEEDVESWRREAERWSRMFFLGITGEHHQLSLLEVVEQQAVDIYHRVYIPITVPEKVLLLLQAFLVEFSCVAGQEASLLQSRFSKFCDTILADLLSYAEKCVVAMWEYELDGPLQLPGTLTGRLGGPSQRWLPAQASFVVMKAVVAVETVTKCYSWLFSRVKAVMDSAGVWLWKLAWKLLSVFNEQEEVRAEIQLAALEALAFVCKALPLAFTSLVIQNAAEDLNAEITVDCLVNKLMKLYDDILREGKLGRSRRAVLTRHKWCCLAELLTLHDIKPEESAISSPNLLVILQDATDSLGSASEDYFLPLFKSIRWLIHWRAVDKQNNPSEIMWELVRSGWACISDSNKRRISILAAFLSTFFHPELFKLPDMHDSEGRPLKWLLGKMIELGSRSPRTMRLTALHLTGLWLKYPETTISYIPELKSMCLYGGDAIDEEFDGEIFDNECAGKEYSSLVQSSDPELQEVFSNTNMFVRVAVAVMIDKLGELAERVPTNDLESRITIPAAANCGRLLLFHLLQSAENDVDLSKELYKKFSAVHRKKIRVWQTLCLLSRFTDDSTVEEVTRILNVCLNRNNMPSVRQYIEMFAVQLYLRFPDLVKKHLVVRLMDFNMKAQELSSYVHIAANVIKFVAPALKETMLEALLPAIFPHMTSHHHNLRTFTQVLLFQVLQPSAVEALGPKCLRSIALYLEENVDCKRLRTCVDQFLFKLEPGAASNPRGLFCAEINDTNKKMDDRHFECVPASVMDKVTEILNETREELRESMASDALLLNFGDDRSQKQESHKDFQKKIVTNDIIEPANGRLENIIHEDELLFSMIETKGRELAKAIESRQELIVVASLIERVPNLAGLARSCEVFKASALVVPNKSVLEDRQFKLISVTAEQWVPVLEVPEASVNHFLEQKKSEGYTILGLEQTANSVSIDKYSFPRKVVLVLGREKDGIPVNIIQAVDACVEIPQLGMIRSLNVHVSGAIAVWEYTKQRLKKI